MENMSRIIDAMLEDFSWEDLGDIDEGRKNLGNLVHVSSYRLFQFSVRKILEHMFDEEKAKEVFRLGGLLAGNRFAAEFLDKSLPFPEFAAQLQKVLKEELIGILQIEKLNLEELTMVLTVAEDLDCSGLPIYGMEVCDYDEGFIAGILHYYTGHDFDVKEIDCWATGGRVCRFDISVKK